jgi:hypothetical protein
MNAAEHAAKEAAQAVELERLEAMREFAVTVVHPRTGALTVTKYQAHYHTTDDEGNLSLTEINIDGSKSIRHMFNVNRWMELHEVGTSIMHQTRLVIQ